MARTTLAAGTIPWRIRDGELEVLLVHRPRYDDWAWAKGKLEAGETLAECAVRETQEETGVAVRLGRPLGVVRHALPGGGRKETHYWVGVPLAPDSPALRVRADVTAAPPSEIDEVRWVTQREARRLLTHEGDHAPLDLLSRQFEDGRLDTWTLAVVRHGRAVKRSAWKKGRGGEDDRPLTPTGVAQAESLVALLSAFGIEDVVSSPWERCVATVRPYLEATGIGAELAAELTEAAHRDHAKPVRRIVDRCVEDGDVPIAVCTHRPVLATVVARIAEHARNRVRRDLPAEDPWLRPGQVLVAHVAARSQGGGVVVEVETRTPAARD